MLKSLILPVCVFSLTAFNLRSSSLVSNNNKDCTFEGKKLYGKVKFVEAFPDVTIQFVTSLPDLKIKFVEVFPDECGEWQVVDNFPDLKVKIVASNADIKVQVVNAFPGEED